MIRRIDSSLPTFKKLLLEPGLNVILTKKEADASDKQTRNRAGKSSIIEIINFVLGAQDEKSSIFRSEALEKESFSLQLEIAGNIFDVNRSGQSAKKINRTVINSNDSHTLSNSEWTTFLGEEMFKLHQLLYTGRHKPTFRSLFSYFARRQLSDAFISPKKQAIKQQTSDYQIALLFLLGLDWQVASDWQKVRDEEKSLRELKKAAKGDTLGNIVGKVADLRTRLAVEEGRLRELKSQIAEFRVLPKYAELEQRELKKAAKGDTLGNIVGKVADLRTKLAVEEGRLIELKSQIAGFRVLPKYAELEQEADQLTRDIKKLANENIIDTAATTDLESAMRAETPPPLSDLENIYAEAGVSLPGMAIKRYDEVRSFHESIIRNRQDYLEEELHAAKQRIIQRQQKQSQLDERRSVVMKLLQSHGAFEHFARLRDEAARQESTVEMLKQRFKAAEQLESTKNVLEIERNRLTLRLRRDFDEQKERLSTAILAYEDISKQLYESAGSMSIDETNNGPEFNFPMQGSRSKGIKNMQIFCFDMMLMRLCAQRGIGPGFLIHDSHLFDGVDGRQLISALKVGAEAAQKLGFQYIVTLNEDDAFKESIPGFDLQNYVNDTVLTDAKEDGGLFGFRF